MKTDPFEEGLRIGRSIGPMPSITAEHEEGRNMTKFSEMTAEQKRMWALDKAIILAMPDHSNDDVIARAEAFLAFITTDGQTSEADAPMPSLQADEAPELAAGSLVFLSSEVS